MIEELGQKLKVGGNEVDRLTNHWNSMNTEFKQKEQDYIKSTQKITDNLDEKNNKELNKTLPDHSFPVNTKEGEKEKEKEKF